MWQVNQRWRVAETRPSVYVRCNEYQKVWFLNYKFHPMPHVGTPRTCPDRCLLFPIQHFADADMLLESSAAMWDIMSQKSQLRT